MAFLGIHFEVDMLKVLQPFVSLALRSFFQAVDTMLHRRHDNEEASTTQFNFSLNCQGIDSNHRWKDGPAFYRQLLDTTLTMKRMNNQAMKIFNKDGTVRETELKIMNFRPMGTNKNSDHTDVLNKQWEEVNNFGRAKRYHTMRQRFLFKQLKNPGEIGKHRSFNFRAKK